MRQQSVSHHYWIEDGKAVVFRSPHRDIWPSELDVIGGLAGLRLVERWADWNRAPFTAKAARTFLCG